MTPYCPEINSPAASHNVRSPRGSHCAGPLQQLERLSATRDRGSLSHLCRQIVLVPPSSSEPVGGHSRSDVVAGGVVLGSVRAGNTMDREITDPKDRLSRLFGHFDTDGDGLISEQEFSGILETLGWHSPSEVRSLEFAAIDRNSDGLVEFQEFSDWWLDQN
jgi:calmodulin